MPLRGIAEPRPAIEPEDGKPKHFRIPIQRTVRFSNVKSNVDALVPIIFKLNKPIIRITTDLYWLFNQTLQNRARYGTKRYLTLPYSYQTCLYLDQNWFESQLYSIKTSWNHNSIKSVKYRSLSIYVNDMWILQILSCLIKMHRNMPQKIGQLKCEHQFSWLLSSNVGLLAKWII